MGWRFRRSVKIAPGIRWNLSKSGSSMSFGGHGYTVNVAKRGVRQTVGLPGTGLSFSSSTSHRTASSSTPSTLLTAAALVPHLDSARFGIEPNPIPQNAGRARRVVTWVMFVTLAAAFAAPNPYNAFLALGGFLLLPFAVLLPSKSRVEPLKRRDK